MDASGNRQSSIRSIAFDTVKRLLAEDRDLDKRLTAVKKSTENVKKSTSAVQLESSLIDQQLAVCETEARLKKELKELKIHDITSEECKRFEWEAKKSQAEMILEKEEKTLAIHYERMKTSRERNDSLRKGEFDRHSDAVDALARAKERELNRIESFKDEIRMIYESVEFSEDVDKLQRDLLILKKRNAAVLLRLTKKAEHLEEQLRSQKRDF